MNTGVYRLNKEKENAAVCSDESSPSTRYAYNRGKYEANGQKRRLFHNEIASLLVKKFGFTRLNNFFLPEYKSYDINNFFFILLNTFFSKCVFKTIH